MADVSLIVADKNDQPQDLLAEEDGLGRLTLYRKENVAQRAELLAKLDEVKDVVAALLTASDISGLATDSTLGEILAKLIATPATEAGQATGNASLASIDTKLSTLAGYVDGLEALLTTLNTYVDGLEGLQGTANTSLSGLATLITTLNGYVDGLETLLGSTNSTLTAVAGYVDGLETLSTALNGYVDTLEALTAQIGTRAYGTPLTRVAIGSSSAQSAAITATEALLHASARCFFVTGPNPTATTDGIPLEAGEKFHVRIISGHKVAVIQDTTAGFLNIIPVA